MDFERQAPRLHGCLGAYGPAAHGDGKPQQDDAPLIIDSIRNDPEWNNGNYTSQPRSVRLASVFYSLATAGGTLAYQKMAPTREAADKLLNERLAAPFAADANDVLYMWDSSRGYNPSAGLERIQTVVLAINSADASVTLRKLGLWSVN